MFANLEGKGGERFGKKEGASGRNGRNRGHWEGWLWGVHCSSLYKIFLIWGNLKIVLEEGFVEFI